MVAEETKVDPSSVQPRVSSKPSGKNQTSILAPHKIPEETLRQYLASKHSPLAELSPRILESPYWSMIIAICTIEQYSCSKNPNETNNLWGIMCSGRLCRYDSLLSGIAAIDAYLVRRNDQGLDTVEKFRTQNLGNGKFRAIYCYEANSPDHICWGWERTVIKTLNVLHSLE